MNEHNRKLQGEIDFEEQVMRNMRAFGTDKTKPDLYEAHKNKSQELRKNYVLNSLTEAEVEELARKATEAALAVLDEAVPGKNKYGITDEDAFAIDEFISNRLKRFVPADVEKVS